MKHVLRGLFGVALLLAGAAGPALGQDGAAERAHSEQHLKEQHAAIEQRLAAQESACYQRFAVSSCLRSVRRQAREERAALNASESTRKDALRRSRAAQHERNLQERQHQAEDAAPPAVASTAHPPRARRSEQLAGRAASPSRIREVQAERARTHAQRAGDAEAARQRLLDKQRAAALRLQAHERRQARLDAKGHPHAAPLPDPP